MTHIIEKKIKKWQKIVNDVVSQNKLRENEDNILQNVRVGGQLVE